MQKNWIIVGDITIHAIFFGRLMQTYGLMVKVSCVQFGQMD